MKKDEEIFHDIYEAYFEPVCRFLNLYTKDESVIEDIMQEVFCNLWLNRDFLRIKHVKSYLFTSARNRILNHIRNQKLHDSLLASYMIEESELDDNNDYIDKEEYLQRIENAISILPPKCGKVFRMNRYEKMTYRQIAEKEGISEKMVEKHISTALKKIKEGMRR